MTSVERGADFGDVHSAGDLEVTDMRRTRFVIAADHCLVTICTLAIQELHIVKVLDVAEGFGVLANDVVRGLLRGEGG